MKKIAVFLSVLIAAMAHASTWMMVAEGESFDFYVDTSTISDMGNGIRQFWGQRQFRKPYMFNGKAALSALEFIEVECRARTMRYLEIDLFESHERTGVVGTLSGQDFSNKDRIAPESMAEAAEQVVCAK